MNDVRAVRLDDSDDMLDKGAIELLVNLNMSLRLVHATKLPGLQWVNHAEDEGTVTDPFELAELINRVGRSEDWACLSVRHTAYRRRFAYCCGNMRDLAVEVSLGHRREYAVTPAGARRAPQKNIGGAACEYWCSYSELISRQETAVVFASWLYDLCIDEAYELRRIGPENGWDRGTPWP